MHQYFLYTYIFLHAIISLSFLTSYSLICLPTSHISFGCNYLCKKLSICFIRYAIGFNQGLKVYFKNPRIQKWVLGYLIREGPDIRWEKTKFPNLVLYTYTATDKNLNSTYVLKKQTIIQYYFCYLLRTVYYMQLPEMSLLHFERIEKRRMMQK